MRAEALERLLRLVPEKVEDKPVQICKYCIDGDILDIDEDD